MKTLYFILVSVLSFSFVTFSQSIPQTLNYQGVLKDGSGVILSNGNYSLTFKLYNAESGGTALWTETKSVTVQDGVFSTQLGSTTPINLPFTESYYLGVSVGAFSELTPRFPLSSVPYSLMSLNVPDGSITAAKISNGQVVKSLNGLKDAVTLVAGSNVTITPNGNNLTISSAGGGGGGIGGSGTTDYIPIFTEATSIGNSSISQISGGDVLVNNIRLGMGNSNDASNTVFGFDALSTSTSGLGITAIGSLALNVNSTGYHNTATGSLTLAENTAGHENTAVGTFALRFNTIGNDNTAIGSQALFSNTSGAANTAMGFLSLYTNINGAGNVSIGYMALNSNSTGDYNTGIGHLSLSQNTIGNFNTAVGRYSLFSNTTGNKNTAIGVAALQSNTTASGNTAIGSSVLTNNSTGVNNTSIGFESLFSNTIGYDNTAIGWSSLYSNTWAGGNTAIGTVSLYSNTTGYDNTATGGGSLYNNTTGYRNTSNGFYSLYNNTTGYSNTANGYLALRNSFTGWQNTSVGASSMLSTTTGSYNTALGYNTGPNAGALFNTTCLGIDATATGNNMVRIGNTFVTSIGGQVGWSTLSDGRFKEGVNEDVPGLSFITQLRPVTYQINKEKFNQFTKVYEKGADKEENGIQISQRMESTVPSERVTGFIAQEVEQIANNLGYDFSGIDKPENINDYYGLRYGEFVVPLVKAVQEQQKIIEESTRRIEALEGR